MNPKLKLEINTPFSLFQGAHCLMCDISHKDSHKIDLIRGRFPINRSIESLKENFEQLKQVSLFVCLFVCLFAVRAN